MKQVGYIVQYFDEDLPLPSRTGKWLYRTFEQAEKAAFKMAIDFVRDHQEDIEGPFLFESPKQEDIDVQISVIAFRSRDITIWIETVYEN